MDVSNAISELKNKFSKAMITVIDLALLVDDLANGYSDTEGTENGSDLSSDEGEDSANIAEDRVEFTEPRKVISQMFHL